MLSVTSIQHNRIAQNTQFFARKECRFIFYKYHLSQIPSVFKKLYSESEEIYANKMNSDNNNGNDGNDNNAPILTLYIAPIKPNVGFFDVVFY